MIQAPTHITNYGDGQGGFGTNRGRRFIILHGTGRSPAATAAQEIGYLQRPGIRVSYHAYATKTGEVHHMVPWAARAWHAGSSRWRGTDGVEYTDLNDLSIGIAFESTNAFDEVYPHVQVSAVFELVRDLMVEHDIPPERVLTHREVSYPQGRKVDPVNFGVVTFRERLAWPPKETLPLYSEENELLGEVTVVDDRKAYLPNDVLTRLRGG